MGQQPRGNQVQGFEITSEGGGEEALQGLRKAFDGRLLAQKKERRRYLDTFDWRIHRAGGWLCEMLGSSPGVLLASVGGSAPLTAPANSSPAFMEDLPEGPLRSAFEQIVTPRRLAPVAVARRTTQTLELLDVEGKVVSRVTAITNELTDLPQTKTHALLLEGIRGYDEELQAVRRFLNFQLRLQPTSAREIDGILAHLGEDAGRDPSALDIQLSPQMTAGEAVSHVLARLCEVIEVNRDGVQNSPDTEFLHDFRVAVRRTRSILGQLDDVLPSTAVKHYAKEFRWLGELTGRARDLDVFLLNMPAYRLQLGAQDAASLDALNRLLAADRKKEQTKLAKALRGQRLEKLLRNWKVLLHETTTSHRAKQPALAERPVLEVVSRCIWKRYRKVRRSGLAIDHDSPSGQLHSLRIQCKKLRYLLEVFRSLYAAQPLNAAIKELKRLQNTLGDFNDAQVHADLLRGFAERLELKNSGADTIVAIGRLVSELLAGRERERERFFGRFEDFATDENHARFRALFKDEGAGA